MRHSCNLSAGVSVAACVLGLFWGAAAGTAAETKTVDGPLWHGKCGNTDSRTVDSGVWTAESGWVITEVKVQEHSIRGHSDYSVEKIAANLDYLSARPFCIDNRCSSL